VFEVCSKNDIHETFLASDWYVPDEVNTMPEATTSPGDSSANRTDSRSGIGWRRLTRYDLLLAVVPAAFLAGALLSVVAGVPLRTALPAAALVAALAIVDGLFLNPPRRPRAGDGAA